MRGIKMKILHYIPGFNTGGIESVFLNWYKNLENSDITFELLVRNYNPDSPMLKEYLNMGGILHTLDTPALNPKTMFAFRKKVSLFFKTHRDYDFVHMHVADDPFILNSARKNGIKEIGVHAHTTGYNESYKQQGLKKMIRDHNVNKANHYFSCSHEAAEWMFPQYLNRVQIIHNGIDTVEYEFDLEKRNQYRDILKIGNALVLVHVGRFSEVKNHIFLLEVFEELKKNIPNVKLLLVGDGDLLPEIASKFNDENIHYLGARLDVPEILQAADIFLLPSKFEGLGMSAIESQGAGLPTLVSNRVPLEVKVTDLVEFISIDNGVEPWVNQIMECQNSLVRESTTHELLTAHYDIKQTTRDLCQYYKDI